MTTRKWTIAALFLLAACGKGGDEAAGNNGSQAATTVAEAVDENLYDDQSNQVVPLPAASPHAVTAFPAAFQGRWGLTENDCDPARADNKGLMVVEPNRLRFYEARATLSRGRATGQDRLDVTLSFEGEGQQWTADQTLTLVDDGKTLVRDEPTPPTSLRYARCPA